MGYIRTYLGLKPVPELVHLPLVGEQSAGGVVRIHGHPDHYYWPLALQCAQRGEGMYAKSVTILSQYLRLGIKVGSGQDRVAKGGSV